MKRNIIFSLFIILVISSCKVGPNYRRPVINSPENFRFDSISTQEDTIINLKWWELFQNDELKALIDTALKYNPDVLIAASRIEESRAVVGYNKADQWPSIGYDGSGSRMQTNVPGGGIQSPFNTISGAANLAWELDFWGKYRMSTEAARAELLASEYGHHSVQVSLISSVASTYILLLDYDSRLAISIKTLDSRKESLRIIGERFNKGIVPEIDLNQAEIQEAIASATIPYYKRLVAQTENALSVLLGNNPGNIKRAHTLRDEVIPPEIPAGIPSSILARRPDINQAEQYLIAQNARIGVAVAQRFPSISLTGMLGAASNELSTLTTGDALVWSLSGGIVGPIFQFGKNKRMVDIERQRMYQDSIYYFQTILQAFREVEDALIEIQTLNQESIARERQMKSAQNAAMLSKERYDGGVTSYLEVLDSERSQFNAELAASEVYKLHLNAYVFLYKALGGGWIDR
ncbi:MAG: efflux transporter outer membrane subunit [Bacteroidales bacterium]|nr:efflux transporter outer membrane subunit [Bacteroidales bacterium]